MIIYDSWKKAIQTKYLGPTDRLGSRYKAFDDVGNSVTISADHRLDFMDNHMAAVRALCVKMKWDDADLICGWTESGLSAVFLPKGIEDAMKTLCDKMQADTNRAMRFDK